MITNLAEYGTLMLLCWLVDVRNDEEESKILIPRVVGADSSW